MGGKGLYGDSGWLGKFWLGAGFREGTGRDAGPAGIRLTKAPFSGECWVNGMLASAGFVGRGGIDSISSFKLGAKSGPDRSIMSVRETPLGSASSNGPGSVFTAALFLATLAQVCRCLRRVR